MADMFRADRHYICICSVRTGCGLSTFKPNRMSKTCVGTGTRQKKAPSGLQVGGVYVWIVGESTEVMTFACRFRGNREKKNKRRDDKDKTISEADLRQQQQQPRQREEGETGGKEVRLRKRPTNRGSQSTIHRRYRWTALFGWRYGNP